MGRFDIRETTTRDRAPEPDRQLQRDRGPKPGRQLQPGRAPERPGHRPNYDPRRPKQDITARMNAAVADVGHYRVVALADLVKERFGGNPFAARKAVDRMKAAGLVTERTLQGPKGGAYRVLVPTATGAGRARTQGANWGLDPEQHTWGSPLPKAHDASHDVAIYRAARLEQARFEERGARLWRVRTDAELKSEINSRSEAARAGGGREAADRARLKAAEALHLPIRNGQVQYPDAQMEFLEPDGLTRGHVNIEVVSGNYRAADIAAKAAAGFQMHGNGSPRAQSLIDNAAQLARSASQGGGGGGGAERGKGSIEL